MLIPTDEIIFFDREGNYLGNVGNGSFYRELQTVNQAIIHFQIKEKAYYLLRIKPFDFDEFGYSVSATLYKPPKHFTFFEWLKSEPEREARKLQQKIAEIDSIATPIAS